MYKSYFCLKRHQFKYVSLQEGIVGICYKGGGSEVTDTLVQIFTQVFVLVAMSNLFLFKPVVLTLGGFALIHSRS